MNTIAPVQPRTTFLRRIGYGIVAWAIPYVTSLPLLPLMRTDPALFKTVMIVEGSVVGAVLAVTYFETVSRNYLREGLLLGSTWIVLSWLLDVVGVVPFAKLTFDRYFIEIGFEYLAMFAPTVSIGYVLERRVGQRSSHRLPLCGNQAR